MKAFYLILTIVGILVPYAFLMPFIAENGLDMSLLFEQAFETRSAAFFGVGAIISAVVVIFWVLSEGKRLNMKNLWTYILGTLLVGVSFGLPLFLFMREDRMKQPKKRKRK